jgi:hypothetical protein
MIDPPVPCSFRIGDGGLRRVPYPGQVHVDDRLPGLLGQLLGEPVGPQSGVGDHDVEATELGDPLVEDELELVVIPHVGLRRVDPAVEVLH